MMRRSTIVLLILLGACVHGKPSVGPVPSTIAASRDATTGQLDSLWAETERAAGRGKWDDVLTLAQRYALEARPGDPRLSRARLYVGEAHLGKHEYLEAARDFRRVSDENPLDSLAPGALLLVGEAYGHLWRRPELDASYGLSAMATYQELLSRYPESPEAKDGQARIAALQDMFAYKSFRTAQYYMRLKAYDSAILYLKDIVVTYPKSKTAPDALVRLIDAYRALNYQEDVQETCEYLRKYHAGHAAAAKTCQGVAAPAAAAPAS